MFTQIDSDRQFLYMFLADCKYYLNAYSVSLNEKQTEVFNNMIKAADLVKQRYGLPDRSEKNNLDRKAKEFYQEFRKRGESVCVEFFQEKYKEVAGKFGKVPVLTNDWLEFEKEWNATHETPLIIDRKGKVTVATIEFSEEGKRYDYLLDDDTAGSFYPQQRVSLVTGTHDFHNMTILELKYYKQKPEWVTTKLKMFDHNQVVAYTV